MKNRTTLALISDLQGRREVTQWALFRPGLANCDVRTQFFHVKIVSQHPLEIKVVDTPGPAGASLHLQGRHRVRKSEDQKP